MVSAAGCGAPASGADRGTGGCFAPGQRPPSVEPNGFAMPDLQAEKDAYLGFGWTWDASAEPDLPAEPGYGVEDPDIHGDTEGDDLWSYLMMHRRTGQPGYLDRARAWARYFKEDYRSCVGGQYASFCYDRDGFGADHLWGWGLLAWAGLQDDPEALAEAGRLAAIVEGLWADNSPFGCLPNNGCTHYGLRQAGRHLLFVTRLAEVTGLPRWAQLRDRILDRLLASGDWDAARGMYFLGDYSTDYSLGEGAYAAGARVQSPFMIGVFTEGLDHAYRVTGREPLRQRMVAMARFVERYGLDPTYEYSGSLFGIVNGQVWHNYAAQKPVTFWDPVYTTSLVNTLVRGYRYTCEAHFLESAKHFFSRGNRGIYGEPVQTAAPEGTVHHFVDTRLSTATGNFYLDYNKGELQYTYLLFEPAGAFATVPAPGAPLGALALPGVACLFGAFWLGVRSRRSPPARVARHAGRGRRWGLAPAEGLHEGGRPGRALRGGGIALVVAAGVAGAAGLAFAGTPYDDLQPGHWRVISKNTIDQVQPCPTNDCSYSAVEGVSGVIEDWCGGALASRWGRLGGLVVWGGGHNGYFGSEVYVFDLDTQLWVRASEPYDNGTGSVAPDCSSQGIYPDGSACAAHTYDRVDYQPTTNRFFILSATDDPVCGGCDDGYVHAFDLDDRAWSLGPEVPNRGPLTGALSAYDASRDVFWFLQTYGAPPLRSGRERGCRGVERARRRGAAHRHRRRRDRRSGARPAAVRRSPGLAEAVRVRSQGPRRHLGRAGHERKPRNPVAAQVRLRVGPAPAARGRLGRRSGPVRARGAGRRLEDRHVEVDPGPAGCDEHGRSGAGRERHVQPVPLRPVCERLRGRQLDKRPGVDGPDERGPRPGAEPAGGLRRLGRAVRAPVGPWAGAPPASEAWADRLLKVLGKAA
jgi:hypothetical protein